MRNILFRFWFSVDEIKLGCDGVLWEHEIVVNQDVLIAFSQRIL